MYEILEDKDIDFSLDDWSWIFSNLIKYLITDKIHIKDVFEILFKSFVEDVNFSFILQKFISIEFGEYYESAILKEIILNLQKIKS